MKKLLLSIALVLGMNPVGLAQTKKFEHNFYISYGKFSGEGYLSSKDGVSTRIGYGLNYYFTEKFSLMPCIACREEVEGGFNDSLIGADEDCFEFVDVPIVALFHLKADYMKMKLVLGIGPVFSFCTRKDSYYCDADPNYWLNGKEKLNDFSVGLQPSIMLDFWKLRVGVENNIGLTNVVKKYGKFGNGYINGIVGTVNFHF